MRIVKIQVFRKNKLTLTQNKEYKTLKQLNEKPKGIHITKVTQSLHVLSIVHFK